VRYDIYSRASVHERPCSRTIRLTNKFSEQKPSRMTNGVSDYEHASWQQRQATHLGNLKVTVRECQLLVNFGSVYIPA
jgi:hypothetical protein